jgi:hypothetical protein
LRPVQRLFELVRRLLVMRYELWRLLLVQRRRLQQLWHAVRMLVMHCGCGPRVQHAGIVVARDPWFAKRNPGAARFFLRDT